MKDDFLAALDRYEAALARRHEVTPEPPPLGTDAPLGVTAEQNAEEEFQRARADLFDAAIAYGHSLRSQSATT